MLGVNLINFGICRVRMRQSSGRKINLILLSRRVNFGAAGCAIALVSSADDHIDVPAARDQLDGMRAR